MSNLEQHKQALFCNDSKAITDYETAMHNAVQAVSSWLKNEKMYLKLALLHDCGKGKASFFKRVLHKFGFFTKLQNHPKIGAKKLENIDKDLSVLIENHHKKNYSQKMKIFQKCDDES